ncbi:MAG: redox-active disulfide protein 2 [Firmicutes bacterium HGW-Firmicutes-11]|jgi:small redox-active disulfide protein 2|nr:MAG: redox-active disulfide protein 2 [Firmicutes bacterium HGW-Firmicutes-11]
MDIKVLGPGCKNCVTLEANTKAAIDTLGLEADFEKVTDYAQIAKYGIMSTPGLVIDGKVVSFGKVLKTDAIIELIKRSEAK